MYPRCISHIIPCLCVSTVILAFTYWYYNFMHYGNYYDDVTEEAMEAFIISSYFYNKSKSLGDNSLAIVMTADFEKMERIPFLEISAWNETNNMISRMYLEKITPHEKCQWIAIFGHAQVLSNPTKILISTGEKHIQIPLTIPSTIHRPVVHCIAPLFANEQWQNALLALHVYKKYQSHMHLYIRSIVTPLYNILREYEKEGYVTIQPWLRVHLLTIPERDFNPNINIEFRNQAAAQTDCLLQYKETAEFISFVDLDDILIPRTAPTYIEEFISFFSIMPSTSYIHYTKENVRLNTQNKASLFSTNQMFSTIQFDNKVETGKMVTKPGHFNHTWIHWPSRVLDGMDGFSYNIPRRLNAITHLKHINIKNDSSGYTLRVPEYGVDGGKALLSQEDMKSIQNDLERMMSLQSISINLPYLPSIYPYSDLIAKCFQDTFYSFHYSGRVVEMKCPGPDRCHFPSTLNINCTISTAVYHSSRSASIINIHYATNAAFKHRNGCIP